MKAVKDQLGKIHYNLLKQVSKNGYNVTKDKKGVITVHAKQVSPNRQP